MKSVINKLTPENLYYVTFVAGLLNECIENQIITPTQRNEINKYVLDKLNTPYIKIMHPDEELSDFDFDHVNKLVTAKNEHKSLYFIDKKGLKHIDKVNLYDLSKDGDNLFTKCTIGKETKWINVFDIIIK